MQGELRNLKLSIANHFNIYQGLEKDDKSMITDHTNYGVLPRKWRKNVQKHVQSKDSKCQIINTKICNKRKRTIVEKQDVKDDVKDNDENDTDGEDKGDSDDDNSDNDDDNSGSDTDLEYDSDFETAEV